MQTTDYEKEKERDLEMSADAHFKKLCPFIRKPSENCYCAALDSLKVEAAIYYCGGNFEECEIYKKLVKNGG